MEFPKTLIKKKWLYRKNKAIHEEKYCQSSYGAEACG